MSGVLAQEVYAVVVLSSSCSSVEPGTFLDACSLGGASQSSQHLPPIGLPWIEQLQGKLDSMSRKQCLEGAGLMCRNGS